MYAMYVLHIPIIIITALEFPFIVCVQCSCRYIRKRRGKFYISDEQARKASISSEALLVYENNKTETISPQSAGEPKLQDSIPTNKITTV